MMSIISSSIKYVRKYVRKVTSNRPIASNDTHDNTGLVTNADTDMFIFCGDEFEAKNAPLDYSAADAACLEAYNDAKLSGLSDGLAIEACLIAQFNIIRPFGKDRRQLWNSYLDCRAIYVQYGFDKCGLNEEAQVLSEYFPGLKDICRSNTKLTIDGLDTLR